MSKNEQVEAEVFDCMSYQQIQDEALTVLGLKSMKEVNNDNQDDYDQIFNAIFFASYCDGVNLSKAKPRAYTTYATFKQGMFDANKYAEKLGYSKKDDKYKNAFLQYFFGYLGEAHEETLTPSGNIKGKNKKLSSEDGTIYVVPNPSSEAISNDIIEMFSEMRGSAKKTAKNSEDEKEKFNHLKSCVNSMSKYLGVNLYGIKDRNFPKKGTDAQLLEAEMEKYRMLIVFTMIIIGVQNVMTVDKDQFNRLFERFLPVDETGKPNRLMLHKTETRQNFVKNIYNTLRGLKTDSKELLKLT
jgi:hypothetical protein